MTCSSKDPCPTHIRETFQEGRDKQCLERGRSILISSVGGEWVTLEKIHTSPMEEISAIQDKEGKIFKMSKGEGGRHLDVLSKGLHFRHIYKDVQRGGEGVFSISSR